MEHGKVSRDFVTMSHMVTSQVTGYSGSHDESNMGEQAHSHSSKVYK